MKKGIADLIREANAGSPTPVKFAHIGNDGLIHNPYNRNIDNGKPDFYDYWNPYYINRKNDVGLDEMSAYYLQNRDKINARNPERKNKYDNDIADRYQKMSDFIVNNKDYLQRLRDYNRKLSTDVNEYSASPEFKKYILDAYFNPEEVDYNAFEKAQQEAFRKKYGYADDIGNVSFRSPNGFGVDYNIDYGNNGWKDRKLNKTLSLRNQFGDLFTLEDIANYFKNLYGGK